MNEVKKNTGTINNERATSHRDCSCAWAAAEIINGPNGKDALNTIKSISTKLVFLIAFGIVLGYAPSISFGNMQLALSKM